MNFDGYALPIKKLKGTEPVESLDLSGKKLRVASTIVIASLISGNGGLTSIDLSGNQLCGVWTQYAEQDGTYTAEIFETAKQRELAMAFVDKAAAEALLIPSKEGTTCRAKSAHV